ncbi:MULTISPECIES: response regulator [Methanobacterium]|jgi:CheY-like chemotaxis protein|uniref:Response regulator n=1 Tax=Methanobacterium subterraneum TaxID=59277 RepID=A0A2H4VPD7_9EURY|nr:MULTISPECIES: response regulator [Methanobacterium]AUB58958.1 response regulator [Methanobacterium sp. MZ-A1]AUB59961.1 response regulator [Methanobacterium subterraneum]NMO09630.1 response regulator [Methanobacterium subterraneum]PKL72992.1 MAG: response regulator [Methanobacteriales archaeon HGW-Methanobacteriales-2]
MKYKLITAVEVLLVEDNPGDVRLIQEVFKEAKIKNVLHVARDGEEAMKMLRLKDKNPTRLPDLILLDLNLPKKDGRDVLKEIKKDDSLKCIPVVVLTNSTRDEDLIETYRNNANCYIAKPGNLDQLIKVVQNIGEFWLNIVRLPPR